MTHQLSSIASSLLLVGVTGITHAEQPAAESVRKGLDLHKYEQLVEDIRINPSHGRIEFRAAGESEEMVYHGTASVGPFNAAGQELGSSRQYILHMGLPIELQGEVQNPVDRIEPVELALAALTDCIIGTIAVHAVTNGIDVDKISATVRAPIKLQVFLGIDSIDKRDQIFGRISVDVEIEGAGLTEKERVFLSEQAMRSNVFNLIALGHDVETTLSIK